MYVVLLFPSFSLHCPSLQSDATRRPVRCKPVTIPVMSSIPQTLPTRDSHVRLRFPRKLFPSSSRTNAVRADQPRNPLDVCFFYLLASHLTRRFPCSSLLHPLYLIHLG